MFIFRLKTGCKVIYSEDDNNKGGGDNGAGGDDAEKPFSEMLREVRDEYEKKLAEKDEELKREREQHAKDLKEVFLGQKKREGQGGENFVEDFAKKMRKKFGG